MEIKNTGLDTYGRVQIERPENRGGHAAAQGTAVAKSDTVTVSDEAVLRTEAYRTAMSASDVRQDKVNAIKDQLANGTYQVNPHRIAANLLQDEAALHS